LNVAVAPRRVKQTNRPARIIQLEKGQFSDAEQGHDWEMVAQDEDRLAGGLRDERVERRAGAGGG